MPEYIRVKDEDTGHEFDALSDAWQITEGLYKPVKPKLYPPSPVPRPAKHNTLIPASTTERDNDSEEETDA
ncbi:hypothetical protein [Arthrobacter woluwensis]|uniref:hypothetical protein n=1 Tax=Arthrobacter woluwensis TaxID=156980 RepID=UPI001AAF4A26|nr:hypothetical protein [Arthrobacter woluwensis]QTF70611.1 hypothetical protein G8758_00225 [Arthrobacter woluwensis]